MDYNPYDANSIIELWKETIGNLNILNEDVNNALESKRYKGRKQKKQLEIIRDLIDEIDGAMSLDDGLED